MMASHSKLGVLRVVVGGNVSVLMGCVYDDQRKRAFYSSVIISLSLHLPISLFSPHSPSHSLSLHLYISSNMYIIIIIIIFIIIIVQ